jgi:hypothetical protein
MAVLKRFRGKTRVGTRHAAGRPQKTRWQPRVEWLERRDLLAALVGTNQPPVAVDDLLTTAQGVPLVFSAEQLLQNDHDADGSFRYEPAEGFVGGDTFVFRATAGGGGGNTDGGSTGGQRRK